ncbi:hypothetical protein TeGR_g8201, partial [Tetraparma gracilis]
MPTTCVVLTDGGDGDDHAMDEEDHSSGASNSLLDCWSGMVTPLSADEWDETRDLLNRAGKGKRRVRAFRLSRDSKTCVSPLGRRDADGDSEDEDENSASLVRRLREENRRLRLQNEELVLTCEELGTKLDKAKSDIKQYHTQQKKLYDGFKLLRSKYDDLKAECSVTLWEYLPSKLKTFQDIKQSDVSIFESPTRLGEYKIGEVLGE